MASETAALTRRIKQLMEEKASLEKLVSDLKADREVREKQMNHELDVQTQEFKKMLKENVEQLTLIDRREQAVKAKEEKAIAIFDEEVKARQAKRAQIIAEVEALNSAKAKLVKEKKEFEAEKASFQTERSATSAAAERIEASQRELASANQKLVQAQKDCAESKEAAAQLQAQLCEAAEAGEKAQKDCAESKEAAAQLQAQLCAAAEAGEKAQKDCAESKEAAAQLQAQLCEAAEAGEKAQARAEALRVQLEELQAQVQRVEEQRAAEASKPRHPIRELRESWRDGACPPERLKLTPPEEKLVKDAADWASDRMALPERPSGTSKPQESPIARVPRQSIDELHEKTARLNAAASSGARAHEEELQGAAVEAMLRMQGLLEASALKHIGPEQFQELAFALHRAEQVMHKSQKREDAPAPVPQLSAAAVMCLMATSGSGRRSWDEVKKTSKDLTAQRKKLSLASAVLREHSDRLKDLRIPQDETTMDEWLPALLEKLSGSRGLLKRLWEIALTSSQAWHLLEDFQHSARRFVRGQADAPSSNSEDLRLLLAWLLVDMRLLMGKDRSAASPWLETAKLLTQQAAGNESSAKRLKTGSGDMK